MAQFQSWLRVVVFQLGSVWKSQDYFTLSLAWLLIGDPVDHKVHITLEDSSLSALLPQVALVYGSPHTSPPLPYPFDTQITF